MVVVLPLTAVAKALVAPEVAAVVVEVLKVQQHQEELPQILTVSVFYQTVV